MSPIREKFVNIIKNLPYNIDEEILKRAQKKFYKMLLKGM